MTMLPAAAATAPKTVPPLPARIRLLCEVRTLRARSTTWAALGRPHSALQVSLGLLVVLGKIFPRLQPPYFSCWSVCLAHLFGCRALVTATVLLIPVQGRIFA